MKFGFLFAAAVVIVTLSSCQTLSRTMQVPGNMMQSIGRSAGLASHERVGETAAKDLTCEVEVAPEFD